MKWSWRVARVAGIDVFVHWTFLILLGWIGTTHLLRGGLTMAADGVVFVLAVFGCVVLHELGHAVAARRYGIETRDITLLPIGGVARLERMPRDPRQELWVALAGPAVNGVLAATTWVAIAVAFRLSPPDEVELVGGDFLSKLLYVNVFMAGFNLLPAFPMDGGRVLRALVAHRTDYTRATQLAANVGQLMAIAFGIAGLFFNWFLLFIAIFVYVGAQQEAHATQARVLLEGVPVRDATVSRFTTLEASAPLRRAASELLAGEQQDFPVLEGGALVGMLPRAVLLTAIAAGRHDDPVGSVTVRDCGTVDEGAMLVGVWEHMHESGCAALPVTRAGELVGVVTLENVGEWMMLRGLSESGPAQVDWGAPGSTRPRA